MDAVAPALIGIGLFLAYEAWESHKNGTSPNPLAKIIAAVQGTTAGSTAATTNALGESTNPNVAAASTPAVGQNPPVSTGAGESIRGN